jgi:hypothetical protein
MGGTRREWPRPFRPFSRIASLAITLVARDWLFPPGGPRTHATCAGMPPRMAEPVRGFEALRVEGFEVQSLDEQEEPYRMWQPGQGKRFRGGGGVSTCTCRAVAIGCKTGWYLTIRSCPASRGPPAVPHGLGGWGRRGPSWNVLGWRGGDRQTEGPMGAREMHCAPAWADGGCADMNARLLEDWRTDCMHGQSATARIYGSNTCTICAYCTK